MVDKAIELLKMLKIEIENDKTLCPFPYRDLIYSLFLNTNGTLKDDFISIFPIEKANKFYRVISIMGTANGSTNYNNNDYSVSSVKGNITRRELVLNIDEMIDELSKYCMNKEDKISNTNGIKEHDVFISHANKDKEDFVEDLYQSLSKLGVDIFYDKTSIEWGDNWKNKILNGTKNAEFAIIVISENFFDREWTERELSEFLNMQNKNGQKLILPIIHNITAEELKRKYPNVADVQAVDSEKYTSDEIALMFAKQLIKRLKNN